MSVHGAAERSTRRLREVVLTVAALHAYLGEFYPSGSAYVQEFHEADADEAATPVNWPKSLNFLPLDERAAKAKGVGDLPRAAAFAGALKTELSRRKDVVTYVYIPAKEGMDESHDASCNLKTKLTKSTYADGDDFFQTIADFCFFDEQVGVYAAAPKLRPERAYQVLALEAGLELGEVTRYAADKQMRPLTAAEAKSVAADKKAQAKPKTTCVTEPAFLDSAYVLFSAPIKGGKRSLRVSEYANPGCGGHLGYIYVLDELDDGKVVHTRQLIHYYGAI